MKYLSILLLALMLTACAPEGKISNSTSETASVAPTKQILPESFRNLSTQEMIDREAGIGVVREDNVSENAEANSNNTEALVPESTSVSQEKPVIRFESTPANETSDYNFDFSFTVESSNSIVSIECQLNNESWVPCSNSFSGSVREEGTYSFQIKTVDAAGNEGTTYYNWKVVNEQVSAEIETNPALVALSPDNLEPQSFN